MRNNFKKVIFIVGICFVFVVLIFFSVHYHSRNSEAQTTRLQIVTTIFPLYDFSKVIGGDKVEVSLLLPPGVEAHNFEPKPSDVIKINEADIFIYTGKFMEPWVADVLKGVSHTQLKVVDASTGIQMLSVVLDNKDEPTDSLDPHIWLCFDNDKIIVEAIAEAFMSKDPSNTAFYQKNAADYKNKLEQLDKEYASTLSNCSSRQIIYAGHYAFGYLANRYHLQYSAAQGVSPDAEPTAQDLIHLVDQVKRDNIHYIFYEEFASPKIATTLAEETGVELLLLSAAHNISKEDFDQQISFFSIMENNLANFSIGLQCH